MKAGVAIALEWRRIRRDSVFWMAAAVMLAALTYGLGNGFAWVHYQQDTIARADAIERESIAKAKADAERLAHEGTGEIDPWSDPRSALAFESDYLQQYDCLPPSPLAMIAVGQSDLLPSCVRVTTGPFPTFLASYEWENPLRLLLGRFDCAFVVIYMLPLLILSVSFNLLSRERELGTLPLLFSYPISPQSWLAVGLLMRAFLLVGLAVAGVIAGLYWGGFDPTAQQSMARLALWVGAASAYAGFWFGLAWWVNAQRRSSAVNALMLAGAWLVLVIMLPALLNLVVKQIYPLPSRMAQINAMRQATAESEKDSSALLKKYSQDHPELAATGDPQEDAHEYVRTLMAINLETERLLAPSQDRFKEQSGRQQTLIEGLSWISPAILFQQASNAISGNDQFRHQFFLGAVDRHRAEVKGFFDPAFVSDEPFDGYDAVPKFRNDDVPLRAVSRKVMFGSGVLLGLTFLCSLMGWRALRRPLFES